MDPNNPTASNLPKQRRFTDQDITSSQASVTDADLDEHIGSIFTEALYQLIPSEQVETLLAEVKGTARSVPTHHDDHPDPIPLSTISAAAFSPTGQDVADQILAAGPQAETLPQAPPLTIRAEPVPDVSLAAAVSTPTSPVAVDITPRRQWYQPHILRALATAVTFSISVFVGALVGIKGTLTGKTAILGAGTASVILAVAIGVALHRTERRQPQAELTTVSEVHNTHPQHTRTTQLKSRRAAATGSSRRPSKNPQFTG